MNKNQKTYVSKIFLGNGKGSSELPSVVEDFVSVEAALSVVDDFVSVEAALSVVEDFLRLNATVVFPEKRTPWPINPIFLVILTLFLLIFVHSSRFLLIIDYKMFFYRLKSFITVRFCRGMVWFITFGFFGANTV